MTNKKNIYRFLGLLVGLTVLLIMAYKIGWAEITAGLLQMGWWFGAIIALWLIIYILNAWSWGIIIQHEEKDARPPFWHLVRITISGFAINYITPVVALGGEPFKIFELKEYMSTAKATSSVLLYSMMHIFTHIIFWMSAIILALAYLPHTWLSAVLLCILFAAFLLLVIVFLQGYKNGLIMYVFNLLKHIPFVKVWSKKQLDQNKDQFIEIDLQIAHLHTHRRQAFYASFGVELLSRFVGCLEVNLILMAVAPQLSVSLADAVIITAGYSLFANLVFFVPLQIGSREGGYLLAFEAVALPSAPAFVLSLTTRIREMFWILIGFVLMRLGAGRKLKA